MQRCSFPSLIIVLFTFLYVSCSNPTTEKPTLKKDQLVGETMGTTFSVSYLYEKEEDLSAPLTELLLAYNQSVSTYIKDADISRINQGKGNVLVLAANNYLMENLRMAKQVHQQSKGWFNPCVMPLVNYWGFGYTQKKMITQVDSSQVDSLLALVNFESIQWTQQGDSLRLTWLPNTQLDLSACAKGDAVDRVCYTLDRLGYHNYFVEIGGEVRAKGTTISGFPWRTGIRKPKEGSAINALQVAVELPNMALATSGNYENYYVDSTTGTKYAHTINPHTGYPEKNNLLSASVFAPTCGEADAFATAFMAMGLERAMALAERLPQLEAYFVFSLEDGSLTTAKTSQAGQYLVE
ncbi:MAG: FAD:protein FMN transferase [Aureispira sp.]